MIGPLPERLGDDEDEGPDDRHQRVEVARQHARRQDRREAAALRAAVAPGPAGADAALFPRHGREHDAAGALPVAVEVDLRASARAGAAGETTWWPHQIDVRDLIRIPGSWPHASPLGTLHVLTHSSQHGAKRICQEWASTHLFPLAGRRNGDAGGAAGNRPVRSAGSGPQTGQARRGPARANPSGCLSGERPGLP